MIVVEDGAGHISESAFVTVTSVIQTSAGKMIFAASIHNAIIEVTRQRVIGAKCKSFVD